MRGRAGAALRASDRWASEARLWLELAKDAQALGQGWSISYYCSGFAAELMLKAIYLRQQKLNAWPVEMRGSRWHDIERLSRSCGLAQDVSATSHSSARFAGAWAVVRDWRSEARYPDVRVDRGAASDTFLAVSDPAWGVFQWLMSRYQRI